MSARLQARLVERIRREGPITFAAFMEAALYDPEDGFYSATPVGAEGAFVTSPHVSGAFAVLIATQLAAMWETLGHPNPFRLVEAGAGDGTLARGVVAAAARTGAFGEALRVRAVERGAGGRRALADAGLDAVERIEDLADGSAECVLANELLDNLPFHRVRNNGGRLVEVMVGERDGTLIEVEGEPTPAALSALPVEPEAGAERVAAPAVGAFVSEVARVIRRGYCILFDYAASASPAPVRGYRDQRVTGDVLADPGSRDVTAGVDFDAVATVARRAGLQVWGPVEQQAAMRALGLGEIIEQMRRSQGDAEAGGDARAAVRLLAERGRATLLADPAHLGGHAVVVLATPGLPRPAIAPT